MPPVKSLKKTNHVSLEGDVVFWRMTLVRLFLTSTHPLVSPSYLGKVTAWGWVPCLSSDSPKYEMTRRIIPFHRELVMQGFCCQVKDQACPQCDGGRVSVFWPVTDKAPVLPTSGLNEFLIFDPSVACPTSPKPVLGISTEKLWEWDTIQNIVLSDK